MNAKPTTSVFERETRARLWTPPDGSREIETLADDDADTVRYLAAANRHVRGPLLRRLAKDRHAMVQWAASRRAGEPPDSCRIPVAVPMSIIAEHLLGERTELMYRFALLGVFEIDRRGRVWRPARLKTDCGRGTCRLVACDREPADVKLGPFGYRMTTFWWRGINAKCFTHRLVFRALKGMVPPGHRIHHVDDDRLNNSPGNLQVMSNAEHTRMHMNRTLPLAILTRDQVREIKRMLADGKRTDELAKRFGVSRGTIEGIKYGRAWKDVMMNDE